MELPMEPLVTLTDVIDGIPSTLEVRQEVADTGTITHVTMVQEGKENRRFDMKWRACEGKDEPHWEFIDIVPAELKDIEWNISEAILERDR